MTNQNELYHFGVRGMKWGVRRYETANGNLTSAGKKRYAVDKAKAEYKSAKKDFKSARKQFSKGAGITGFGYAGVNGISKYKKNESNVGKAEMKMIDAKAKYKASKAKTADKAAKAEFKTYRKEMQKSGLAGSAADDQSRGRSTAMYNHIKAQKGKKYADAVQKKVQNVAVAEFATATVVALGSAAAEAYLISRS